MVFNQDYGSVLSLNESNEMLISFPLFYLYSNTKALFMYLADVYGNNYYIKQCTLLVDAYRPVGLVLILLPTSDNLVTRL